MVDTRDECNDWSRLTQNMEQLDNDVLGIGFPVGCGLILHPDGELEPIRSFVDLFVVKDGLVKQSVLAPVNAFPDSTTTSETVPVAERFEKVPLTQFFATDSDICAGRRAKR
jgi:hypothetical protein